MTRAELEVLAIALACAGTVAAVGLVAVRLAGRRSVRAALVSVALVSVLSVVTGVVGTARAMFISSHDLGVVLPVSAIAGAVGLLAALSLAATVVRDVERVRVAARTLGSARAGGDIRIGELAEIDSELVAAAERLTEANRRERALESSRRELVAWVSHDLRTPLAGLRAMAEALEDGVAPDVGRYHAQIRREVDRLAGMVDDLFELSRIQSGALSLTVDTVDVRELVDDVVAGSRPMAEAGGVRLGARFATDAAPGAAQVRGDAAELGRVLANLVVNAIRHTPSDGTVEVVARTEDSECVLEVSDACGGLGDDALHRVFEAGWRGTSARTPGPDGGAGLGLAIARGIVEAHAGAIDVVNTDVGCRFRVRLPRTGATPLTSVTG
ncbi:MAG TPA: HAMP domain-containing sensor histidine kinase [Kineosporiaceae bacterium]|nr:HAMP domain-containing sensor histidine kinase [Kineosporiaceae bacterium]